MITVFCLGHQLLAGDEAAWTHQQCLFPTGPNSPIAGPYSPKWYNLSWFFGTCHHDIWVLGPSRHLMFYMYVLNPTP